MTSRKKKKSCSSCKGYHSPPVGKRCDRGFDELEDGEDWADFCESHPASHAPDSNRWDTDWHRMAEKEASKHVDVDYGALYMGMSSQEFDMAKTWPALDGSKDGLPRHEAGPKTERQNVRPDAPTRPAAAGGSDHKKVQELDMKRQVSQLQEEICKLSADNKSSTEKLTRIEQLLSTHQRVEDDRGPANGHRYGGRRPPSPDPAKQTRGRPASRGRQNRVAGKMDYSPSSTSPYGSDSTSSRSPSPRRRPKATLDERDQNDRSKRRRYKLTRFLPKDERNKTLNTEKLWFCHGQLMLEQYRNGVDIEGMLKHNVFIAEKTASRAYLSSGIVKYDEAVRDRAKIEGDSSYSGGDMSLAMRFLSQEYARPKANMGGNSFQPNARAGNFQNNGQKKFGNAPSRDPRNGKVFCWLYNGVGCSYENCRYSHICAKCLLPGHSQHSCRSSGNFATLPSQPPVGNM